MSLTEFEIINKYFKGLTSDNDGVSIGIGDDAAVIDVPSDQQLVTSVDTLVSGVHYFSDTDPYDIGYKSLAVNLSDMAAMSASPRWVTLSLTIPENNPEWISKFAEGFSDLANQYGVSLIGGDLTHGPLSITVQIMGVVEKNCAVKRSGAGVGDRVYVSGYLGGAGLALRYLKKELEVNIQPSKSSVDRLLRPEPRVKLGLVIRDLASSAIDISDGLVADLGHILEASNKGALIELDSIPLSDDLIQINNNDKRLQIALCSGDDYELCFTVPVKHKEKLEQVISELNIPITCIGKIIEEKSIKWLTSDGTEYQVSVDGYRHF